MTSKFNKKFLVICSLFASVAFSNVALDDPQQRGDRRYLFFKTGKYLERYACPISEETFTPSNCQLETPSRREATAVYEFAIARISSPLKNLDQSISKQGAEIAATDAKIDSVLAISNPTHQNEEALQINAQISKTQEHLIELAILVRELTIQQDNIEGRFRSTSDEDLNKQLIEIRQKLANARKDHDLALLKYLNLRTLYIEKASESNGAAALGALRVQRRSQGAVYMIAIKKSQDLLESLARENQFINELVNDESFTYSIPREQLGTEELPFLEAANFNDDFEKTRSTENIGASEQVFVTIPPGSFIMGSADNNPGPNEPGRGNDEKLHPVTIKKAFKLQTTEVTQSQWTQVMANNPSILAKEESCPFEFKKVLVNGNFIGLCPNNPVESVTWNDVQIFLQKLNSNIVGPKFRLPTEAEWEIAARSGIVGKYEGKMSDFAVCGANSHQPAGKKLVNGFGLYDVLGNVGEWTSDSYKFDYENLPKEDPSLNLTQSPRVVKGGDFNDSRWSCRFASRLAMEPNQKSYFVGLRLAKDLE